MVDSVTAEHIKEAPQSARTGLGLDGAYRSLAPFAPFILFTIGWAILFLPVYQGFAGGAWARDENAHAPFIMAIIVGIAWTAAERLDFSAKPSSFAQLIGGLLFFIGLASFSIGRWTEAEIALSASQVPLAAGSVALFFGWKGIRVFAFPLFLMLYLIIWPGWLLDNLTFPLKMVVSSVVSDVLYMAGLPVAHAGAVISAGPYQLLVAQACAGLNSLIALTSIGAVYLYIAKRRSLWTNLIVLGALVPIAVAANIIRVMILVLITYYFGHDLGQSFLHEGAGLLMFAVSLLLVFFIDFVAARLFEPALLRKEAA